MNISWKNCLRITLCAFLLYLGIHYWETAAGVISLILSAAAPIIIGFSIAYVLNLLMNFYERHYFPKTNRRWLKRSRRPVCLTAAIATLCGIVAMVILLVIPELTSCVKFLLSEIPPVIEQLLKSQWVADILPADLLSQLSAIDWQSYASKLLQVVTSGLGSAMGVVVTAVSSVFSAIVTAFISIIFSVYLLSGKETLLSQSKRLLRNYLPAKWESRILHWLSVLNDCFRRYIVGQCTEAVILGVLCIIGMLIFQFPYAVMIGTLIGFTALVPVAGAYIGAGVGAIMILTESPVKALLFLVFILVLQQLEGNLIYPKVVGKSIGLPAIWVLAAVTIGGALMGILGMLIGVPIAAAIYRLVREDLQLREKQHAPAEENPS